MRRFLALAFPFIVLAGVLATFVVLEGRRTPDWQVELGEYIAGSRRPGETIIIQRVSEARRPENFDETMGVPVRNDWRWSIDDLPYPPSTLRCVLLKRSRLMDGVKIGSAYQLVFVGYHTDTLWRLGWLAHQGPSAASAQALMPSLKPVSCDWRLDR